MAAADMVLTGGHFITLDQAKPGARSMAVKDGRILEVGDDRDVLALAGPETARIELAGKTVAPGFVDSHIHLMWYGRQLMRESNLVGSASVAQVLDRLSETGRRVRDGWLVGFGFDQDKLSENRFPTRDELDSISKNRPIAISRVCGHAIVVNSAALALASAEHRRSGNERSGLYTEQAAWAFQQYVPPLRREEMEEAILTAAKVALRTGITSVHTLLDVPEQMIGYASLRRRGKLPIRVTGIPPYPVIEELHSRGVDTTFGDEWLRFGGCKLFTDGSLGARTAYLSEPYADAKHTRGLRFHETDDLKQKCRTAQEKGFQLAIHAIGDAAVRETIDAIEYALDGQDNRQHRHRVEHASVCPPDSLERLAARKIVVTLQPQFVTSDTWTAQRLGPRRAACAYPFADMINAGVPVALSSDCPVEKLDAFACVASAVGGHPWRANQTLTVEQALHAYCMGSAYAGFAESMVGSLQPGKLADFVVLSGNPLKMDASQLAQLKAERVFVGGLEVTPS